MKSSHERFDLVEIIRFPQLRNVIHQIKVNIVEFDGVKLNFIYYDIYLK